MVIIIQNILKSSGLCSWLQPVAEATSPHQRRRRREWPAAVFTTVLFLLASMVDLTVGQVCGSQDWYHGWQSAYGITYTIMEASTVADLVALGGTTTNLAAFEQNQGEDIFDPDDPKGAILLIFNLAVKDPIYTIVVSRTESGALVESVEAIAFDRSSAITPATIYALLGTNMDATEITMVMFDGTTLRVTQATHSLPSAIVNAKLRGIGGEFLLQADYNDALADETMQLLVKLKINFDSNSFGIKQFQSVEQPSAPKDHILGDISVSDNFLARASIGTCHDPSDASYSFTGLQIAVYNLKDSNTRAALWCSLCYDLSHSELTTAGISTETYTVVAINVFEPSEDSHEVTTVLHNSEKSKILIVHTEGCDRKETHIKQINRENGGTQFYRVRFSETSPELVDIVIANSDGLSVVAIQGINVKSSASTFTATKFASVSQSSSADFTVGPYLTNSLLTLNSELAFMSSQNFGHQTPGAGLLTSCIKIGTTTNISNPFTQVAHYESDPEPGFEYDIGSGLTHDSLSKSTIKGTYDNALVTITDLNDSFVMNPCMVRVRDVFQTTSHNIAGYSDTPMDISTLTIDNCPDGTAPVTPADYTSISFDFVSLQHEYFPGDEIAMDDFFTNWRPESSQTMAVQEYFSYSSNSPEGTYTLVYKAGFNIETAYELSLLPTQTVTISVLDCNLLEALQDIPDMTLNLLDDSYIYLWQYNDYIDCDYSSYLEILEGPNTYDLDYHDWENGEEIDVYFNYYYQDETESIAVYQLQITFYAYNSPSFETSKSFELTIYGPCNNEYGYQSDPDFVDTTSIYVFGDAPLTFNFDGLNMNNCEFQFHLYDNNVGEVDYSVFQITQANQVPATNGNPNEIEVTSDAYLVIDTVDVSRVGTYDLELIMEKVYDGYSSGYDQVSFYFNVEIIECRSLIEDQETTLDEAFFYTTGTEAIELAVITAVQPSCPNSVFSFVVADSDDFIFTHDSANRQVSVSLQSSTMEAGTYTVEVRELDINFGFVAKTFLTVIVEEEVFEEEVEPEESPVVVEDEVEEVPDYTPFIGVVIEEESTEDGADAQESATEQGISVENLTEEGLTDESTSEYQETDAAEPVPVEIDGQMIYPWQRSVVESNKKEVVEEEVPLIASIYQVTQSGNLTIVFNKEIIMPPIRVTALANDTSPARLLQVDENLLQTLDQQYLYDIKEVLDIRVESSYFEAGQAEIGVANYTLTRLTKRAIDIQVEFESPKKITQVSLEPDDLQISFYKGLMFMDQDKMQLSNDLAIKTSIVPQLTAEEREALLQLSDNVASTMATISLALIALQLIAAMGLKYLWNIMNLLQFLIFMQQWLIKLPNTSSIFLKELKSIALYEFIPMEEIKGWVEDLFGIENNQTADATFTNADVCGDSIFKNGIDRVGSNSLIDNMGAMLALGVAILFLLLVLGLLLLCVKKSPRAQTIYSAIKKKLFYNTFLRYVLQSSLKLQIAACTVLFYSHMQTNSACAVQETQNSSFIPSALILFVLSCCPPLFFFVVYRNKGQLDKKEINDKIGTLYTGFNPQKPLIASHSLLFLIRRSLFVVIMFALFQQPGLQVQLMILCTIIFLIYLSNVEYHDTPGAKRLEIFNEIVFVLIMYCFVLLNGLVWDDTTKEWCGNAIVGLASFLLALNLGIIIVVSIRGLTRKCYLRRLKRQNLKEHERRKAYLHAQALENKAAASKQAAPAVVNEPNVIEQIIVKQQPVQLLSKRNKTDPQGGVKSGNDESSVSSSSSSFSQSQSQSQSLSQSQRSNSQPQQIKMQDMNSQSIMKLEVDEICEKYEKDLAPQHRKQSLDDMVLPTSEDGSGKIQLNLRQDSKSHRQTLKGTAKQATDFQQMMINLEQEEDEKLPIRNIPVKIKKFEPSQTKLATKQRGKLSFQGQHSFMTQSQLIEIQKIPLKPYEAVTNMEACRRFGLPSTFPEQKNQFGDFVHPSTLTQEELRSKSSALISELKQMAQVTEKETSLKKGETRYDTVTYH